MGVGQGNVRPAQLRFEVAGDQACLELAALDLAAGGLGKARARHRHDIGRAHAQAPGHPLTYCGHQFTELVHLVPRNEEQRQVLGTGRGIVDAAGGRVRRQHAGDLVHDVFHLVAVEVGAVDDDHLLLAPREAETAVQDVAEVAAVEPTVADEGLCVGGRMLQIARRHHSAADLEAADASLRHHLVLGVGDADLHARHRRAQVDELDRVGLTGFGLDQVTGQGRLPEPTHALGREVVAVGHAGADLGHAEGRLHDLRPNAERRGALQELLDHRQGHLLAGVHQLAHR